MRTTFFLALLVVGLMTTGFECVNDPIIVSLDAKPIESCGTVNTGNGQFNASTTQQIASLISSDYSDNITGFRIQDIRVRVTGNYPSGQVSGNVTANFGTGNIRLLSFAGQYSQFATSTGVSLLNSGGLITADRAGLAQVVAILSNSAAVPTQVTITASGGGPAVNQNFSVCFSLYMQVDAKAN